MMEDIQIADGSTVKLLLAGLVLASSVLGGLGLAYGTSQAGDAAVADAPESEPQMAFPIDNVTGAQMAFPIDNASGMQMAFPINNATDFQQSAGVLMTFASPEQDMEPY